MISTNIVRMLISPLHSDRAHISSSGNSMAVPILAGMDCLTCTAYDVMYIFWCSECVVVSTACCLIGM